MNYSVCLFLVNPTSSLASSVHLCAAGEQVKKPKEIHYGYTMKQETSNISALGHALITTQVMGWFVVSLREVFEQERRMRELCTHSVLVGHCGLHPLFA